MIFITGPASAGKTSLIKLLKEHLPKEKFDIHDIDEADKWTDDYVAWRDSKVEFWLKQSIKNRKKGIETILCGIIYPDAASKSPSYAAAQPVKFILLNTDAEELKQRFYQRMEGRINRQIEIGNELKAEVKSIDGAEIVETTSMTPELIMGNVIKKLS